MAAYCRTAVLALVMLLSVSLIPSSRSQSSLLQGSGDGNSSFIIDLSDLFSEDSSFPWEASRATGLAAYFLLAAAALTGLLRRRLSNMFGEIAVSRLHAVLTFGALNIALLHAAFVVLDGFMNDVTLRDALVPRLSGGAPREMALGTLGLYMIIIATASGILLERKASLIVRWLNSAISKLAVLAVFFIAIHSYYLGTDLAREPILLLAVLGTAALVAVALANSLVKEGMIDRVRGYTRVIMNRPLSGRCSVCKARLIRDRERFRCSSCGETVCKYCSKESGQGRICVSCMESGRTGREGPRKR